MVTIEKENHNFVFEIQGMHKLWALKSRLTIPVHHIVKAFAATNELKGFFGIKMPGTNIPGLITAGSYIVRDGTIFCDVMHTDKSVVVELQDEHYKRLIIEVEDVEKAIAMLAAQ
jgi:TPP-dependent trihydroxycyclohexane-1,2-dione (THcHDO) dehydratase